MMPHSWPARLRCLSESRSLAALLSFVILFSSTSPSRLRAQGERIIFTQLSIEEGLSQSIVTSIIQDGRGFMWFCTENGLNRYDGYRFMVLKHEYDDPNSLSYSDIYSICEDRSGILWVGTNGGGLNRYDPVARTCTRYRFDVNDPASLSHDIVRTVYEDRSGAIWAGTDRGLNRLDRETGTFTRYLHDPGDPASLRHDIVQAICEDHEGALWIGTDGGGLERLDRETNRCMHYVADPADPASLSHNSVRALCEDKSGVLWVGTAGGGLNALDRERKRFTRYTNDPDDRGSLSHNQVFSLCEDHTGVLWVGTNGGGLNKFDKERGTFTRYLPDPNDPYSLSYSEIYSICEDRSGVLWIGTYGGGISVFSTRQKPFHIYRPDPSNPNSLSHEIVWCFFEEKDTGVLWIGTHGGGLNRLDRAANRYTHYLNDPGDPASLGANIVRVLREDRDGNLWVGTHGGGVGRLDRKTGRFRNYRHDPDNPRSLSHDEIRAIYEDRAGVLWIGTNGGGLNKFDRDTETFKAYRAIPGDTTALNHDFVRVMYEDSQGIFWIGTQGGGLNILDRERGVFTHIMARPEIPDRLSNDYIFSIHEDRSGTLWFGTWGGGLNRYDRATGAFTRFTTTDGLPNNAVYGALEDARGNLWISSTNGLSRFDPKSKTFKNYTAEDGLQSNEFNGGSFYKNARGEMFFGGIHGFNAFYPEEIKDNPYVPQVVITSFLKMNKEVELDRPISELKELRLSYRDYIFAFEFAALDYTAPKKNMYAYKMEGLHEDWIYTGSDKRFASFTTLPHGAYTFRVKGSNNDGVWNEAGASIRIVVTPPFWKTWIFRIFVAVVVLLAALILYKRNLKNVRMEIELKTAHDAQMSIMPQSDPQIAGLDISGACIPANDVGGDFYDIFWQNEEQTRLGVVVGDVSGKAMKAAMIAVMSSGIVYSSADESTSPKDVLNKLNRPLFMKTDDMMFTALCFGSIDTATKEFTYALAGIGEPLLTSNGSVELIASAEPGLPLGAFSDSTYTEDSIRLKTGDVIVLYTDGITEARSGSGAFHDIDGLMRLVSSIPTATLSAKEIKESIIEGVKKFTGNAVQQDDMTLVVIKAISP